VAPDFASSHAIYLTYSEPRPHGASLALARATLVGTQLQDTQVLWRQGSDGDGGQFGANIAFAPDGKSLFLSSGERQRFTPAQDINQKLGKILHLTLDGKPAPGNPMAGKTGTDSLPLFAPPKDTEAAKTVTPTTVRSQARIWRRRRPGRSASARPTASPSTAPGACGRSSTARAAATSSI